LAEIEILFMTYTSNPSEVLKRLPGVLDENCEHLVEYICNFSPQGRIAKVAYLGVQVMCRSSLTLLRVQIKLCEKSIMLIVSICNSLTVRKMLDTICQFVFIISTDSLKGFQKFIVSLGIFSKTTLTNIVESGVVYVKDSLVVPLLQGCYSTPIVIVQQQYEWVEKSASRIVKEQKEHVQKAASSALKLVIRVLAKLILVSTESYSTVSIRISNTKDSVSKHIAYTKDSMTKQTAAIYLPSRDFVLQSGFLLPYK